MKRKTLIKKLEKLIPSLENFNLINKVHLDRLKKDNNDNIITASCLCSDDYKYKNQLPWLIPHDYNVGIIDNELGIKSINYPNLYGTNRKITLSLTDFSSYGNTHCYGNVDISGVEWHKLDNNHSISSTNISEKYPMVKSYYNIDITKVLTEDDINKPNEDWHGYWPGYITERFSNRNELIITAVYVILYRVEGSFIMHVGSPCCFYKKSEALIIVDDNDNVIIGDELKKILKNK